MPLPGGLGTADPLSMMMGGGGPGGPGANPTADAAIGALGQLVPKSPNPTVALSKVDEALRLAHKLVESALPQVSQWHPKVARDLHKIAQSILAAKMDLKKEQPIGMPPNMMSQGTSGAFGLPPGDNLLGGGGGGAADMSTGASQY